MKVVVQRAVGVLIVLGLGYFFPWPTLVYVLCGIYDVARNRKKDASVVFQYFFGNGLFTWLLSPFNILMDLLCLPYPNKGVYRLEDLPSPWQTEIRSLIDTVHREDLVARLEERTKGQPRTMIFFKWYGQNVNTFLDVPTFHEKYRYVKTIGVSVFNRKESTSRHFGPMRATLRVLYNFNDIHDASAFIRVGDVENYWRDNKLFIFDDTLLHQSFNKSDQARYCLFVDVLRPSLLTGLLAQIVSMIRVVLRGSNYVFYKNWKVIKN